MASEEPFSSDAESIQEEVPLSTPKYIKRKTAKKGSAEKTEKKQKKSKFLVTEDDHVDLDSLDRSVGSEAVASDVVENFVLVSTSLHPRTSPKWTVPTSPRSPAPAGVSASWAASSSDSRARRPSRRRS